MAISICQVSITDAPLENQGHAFSGDAGAVVDFWGVVRGLEDGREIEGIDYEAHRAMAQHQLERVAEKARADFQLESVILLHRVGFIAVAEASLFLRVASARREAAFAAGKWVVEELKRTVPIWKRPVFRKTGAERQTPPAARRMSDEANPPSAQPVCLEAKPA